MHQIQNAKIAFFTTEMGLTPQEAEKFWPIYNEYWNDREKLVQKNRDLLSQIIIFIKDEKTANPSELVKILFSYTATTSEEGALHKIYFEKFYKILPIDKVAKLYIAEEEFRMRMIRQLRGGPAANPVITSPVR